MKLEMIRIIDAYTFQPMVGIMINGEQKLKYNLEVMMDDVSLKKIDANYVLQKMKEDILDIVGQDKKDEVDNFFRNELYKDLTLNRYQKEAIKTAIYGSGSDILYPALGLAGEAGEVADKVKKVLRDNDGYFSETAKQEIAKEIGDVMWYCSALARDLGYTLEELAVMNLEKLKSRQLRGVIGGSGDNR